MFVQHVTPGAFVAGLTLLTGPADVVVALVKATLFGLSAGLIACYKGISVGGGPAGVGNAVNETVVFTFIALFVINVLATAVGVQATGMTAVQGDAFVRLRHTVSGWGDGWNRIGRQTKFYGRTLVASGTPSSTTRAR